MKVALGMKIRTAPWGGGNRFGQALLAHLRAEGIDVVDHLNDDDIDVIILTDPRRRSESASFQDRQIAAYLAGINDRALVVHRINECDERKNTDHVNKRLITANRLADHTVFISEWLEGLFLAQGLDCPEVSVIRNGADEGIFHPHGRAVWDGQEPLRLVTHHWSANAMKGLDVYQAMDDLLDDESWRRRFSFTYIGNLPQGFAFRNVAHVPPLDGAELAARLREHHLYLTASVNEPAGMHHIEGGCCGLPMLYRESGGITEYTRDFGLALHGPADLPGRLEEMALRFREFEARMPSYPWTAKAMTTGYATLLRSLVDRRDEVLGRRTALRRWRWRVEGWLGR